MEQFGKKEPFSKETFRYIDLLWMELWKVLGFAKAAVEVMLSGRNTEDIQVKRNYTIIIMLLTVYLFFILTVGVFW